MAHTFSCATQRHGNTRVNLTECNSCCIYCTCIIQHASVPVKHLECDFVLFIAGADGFEFIICFTIFVSSYSHHLCVVVFFACFFFFSFFFFKKMFSYLLSFYSNNTHENTCNRISSSLDTDSEVSPSWIMIASMCWPTAF